MTAFTFRFAHREGWWRDPESNRGREDFQTATLAFVTGLKQAGCRIVKKEDATDLQPNLDFSRL